MVDAGDRFAGPGRCLRRFRLRDRHGPGGEHAQSHDLRGSGDPGTSDGQQPDLFRSNVSSSGEGLTWFPGLISSFAAAGLRLQQTFPATLGLPVAQNLSKGASEMDAKGRLVLPSGIDSHVHLDQYQG